MKTLQSSNFAQVRLVPKKWGCEMKMAATFPVGETADALQELNRGKATAVPDDNTRFGDKEDGSLADGYGRIELDAKDARI